ncbi:GH92 family glycosyl hydrolase [Actinopolymorpha alba]|uniref:GH92 family glycosyl hydrolase n=1 Tax=Actinopolymorpha alba TaxID=533267 RepID=UPI00036F262F|nr:GH92 family glycosyl hydrolase [Actinopolymorpha alba]
MLALALALPAAGALSGAPMGLNHAAADTERFFSSFEPGDPQPTWTDTVELDLSGAKRASGVKPLAGNATPPAMTSALAGGPSAPYNAKSGVGFTGLKSFQYGGSHTAKGHGYSYNKVFDVNVPVTATTELSYLIYPRFITDDLTYPSTFAAVDLAFTDGTYLSDLGAQDQHGATLSPQGQGESKTLYADQWNVKRSVIGKVAAGKTIDRVLIAYDNPLGSGDFGGFIDDLRIGGSTARDHARLTDWVETARGTSSSREFSRGNNIPATAVPHGFNFWTPVTNARTERWLYEYHRDNNADNRPKLEALALSHSASPWVGDRQTLQVMPSGASGTPITDKQKRALPFQHDNEITKPHHYRVAFDNGIVSEIAPTDHAAMFRFVFPDNNANLVFDHIDDRAAIKIDSNTGVLTGWSDFRVEVGAGRMFIYATFDKPIVASETGPKQTGYAKFAADNDRTVTMRIATSLISLEQAKKNLELEIAPADTFEAVKERAQKLWDAKLGVIEVEGATEDQLTTLYSNLYRLFLYPNSGHENVGTTSKPVYKHVLQSTSSREIPAGTTETETGAKIIDGKLLVNNGFWDTYRTAWPAYALLTPKTAGELVDGFVQHYRDGGWTPRWSAPGYGGGMTGTSSDVAFADLFVKGVPGIDARDTYDAAVKNATVVPPVADPYNDTHGLGRKGLVESIFLGYTPTRVSESPSWALEGYINDYGIANMAATMAKDPTLSDAERQRLREEQEYFQDRARNYVNMFDPAIEFFQGRDSTGKWKTTPEQYDPRVWGNNHDYTETNGWGFAFHVPHDGRGLANLYGGRKELGAKLDTFFGTPETAKFPGSYGGVIHEMIEARDVRMGQWGISNQMSYHIPWMYLHAGEPWKTQKLTREAVRRLFTGSEIGQGYPGDDDNGASSSWYILSALGLYPLQVGSSNWAIGSPLFTKATIHLGDGKDLVIKAPKTSQRNVYVQGLKVNGQTYQKSYLPHDLLAKGAVLEFDMGPRPSSWGSSNDAMPPTITDNADVPQPLQDATGPNRGTATPAALFDNNSGTEATLSGNQRWAQYEFRNGTKQQISFYTLTSGKGDSGADPRNWTLQGSNDGKTWTVVDKRDNETFRWRQQTRPFKLAKPANFSHFRIAFTGSGTSTSLAEVEFLTSDKVAATPISVDLTPAIGWVGKSTTLDVTVKNTGNSTASGVIKANVPAGWSVQPENATFDLAGGATKVVKLDISVPKDTEPKTHPVEVSVTSNRGDATGSTSLHVFGNVIAFTPDTAAEQFWLHENGLSQIATWSPVYDGHARFADNDRYFVYRFDIPQGVTGGSLTLDIAQQFLVQVSTDGKTWRTVLEEKENVRDLSNRAERTLDLNELRGDSGTLYVRVGDSHPADGWGAWLARTRLAMDGI